MNTLQDSYHVDIQPGVLITCDSAALQILKFLDRQRAGSDKFIIKEVDDTHLFVHGRYVEQIKDLLQEELEKNTYSQDPEM